MILAKLAKIYVQKQRYEDALFIYKLFREKEFVTNALHIYYYLKDFKALIEYKNECKNNYDVKDKELLLQIGSAYEEIKDNEKAINIYLTYGQSREFLYKVINLISITLKVDEYIILNYVTKNLKLQVEYRTHFMELMQKWHERIEYKYLSECKLEDILCNGKYASFFLKYIKLWEKKELSMLPSPIPSMIVRLSRKQETYSFNLLKEIYEYLAPYLSRQSLERRIKEEYSNMLQACDTYISVGQFSEIAAFKDWINIKNEIKLFLEDSTTNWNDVKDSDKLESVKGQLRDIKSIQDSYYHKIKILQKRYDEIENFYRNKKIHTAVNQTIKDKELEYDAVVTRMNEVISFEKEWNKANKKIIEIKEILKQEKEKEKEKMNDKLEDALLEKDVNLVLKLISRKMSIEDMMDLSELSARDINLLVMATKIIEENK